MVSSRWALLSTFNKEGIEDLSRELLDWNYGLLASDGTASHLTAKGLRVRTVASLTGWEQLLHGRVKTLHPRIMAGILADRDKEHDMKELEGLGVSPIDVVVVNLYPFEEMAKTGTAPLEAVEMVDVGGVALIRAAAKNWPHVSVLTSSSQYAAFVQELRSSQGEVSKEIRRRLAVEAFAVTSRYEASIYNYLSRTLNEDAFPAELRIAYGGAAKLRYGENPYQKAAFYRDPGYEGASVAQSEELFGRGLSFNNILDLDAALELIMKFDRPTAAIIKHTNASGVASSDVLGEAYKLARATDPKSAYGSVVGFNRKVDGGTAEAMKKHFIEAVIAPDFEEGALEILRQKKKLRALRTGRDTRWEPCTHALGIRGGILVQTRERVPIRPESMKTVTKVKPTQDQVRTMLFAYKVLGHVKSNGIVLAKDERTVGIGSGQMSRVDAVVVAGMKAGKEANGSVLASDAFFPFRDGIDEAARVGVEAIVQPGGSIRDDEVIQAANEHGMAMVFTGVRVFKH
ncbi:MAG: bifunctional phosphoribosylaminoimidazolecarboxamide formyltransferase/IMP cyclohydrolase [Thermoplasmata archaeon]